MVEGEVINVYHTLENSRVYHEKEVDCREFGLEVRVFWRAWLVSFKFCYFQFFFFSTFLFGHHPVSNAHGAVIRKILDFLRVCSMCKKFVRNAMKKLKI